MIGRWSFVPGKPIVRGYDTGALFRDDCLLHIQHLQMELESDMKKEYAAAEEQLRQRKKKSLAGSTHLKGGDNSDCPWLLLGLLCKEITALHRS